MKNLPAQPSLEFLKREARSLKSSHRALDESICEVIGHFDTSLHGLANSEILQTPFSLLDAQRVVARQYGFSSWNRIRLFVERSKPGSFTINAGLRHALLNRRQEIDAFIEKERPIKWDSPAEAQLLKIAADNAEMINPVFDRYGWPGPDIVGVDGVEACMAVVGNSVSESELQFRASSLLNEALPNGCAFGYHYAMISDRCKALSGKPTVYGISPGFDDKGRLVFSRNVVDPDNLDQRRATVGFESFEMREIKYIAEATEKGWNLYPDRDEFNLSVARIAEQGGYI